MKHIGFELKIVIGLVVVISVMTAVNMILSLDPSKDNVGWQLVHKLFF